ncbi:MAG: fasciclin domain-containing protein [Ginsengibacter sp.]
MKKIYLSLLAVTTLLAIACNDSTTTSTEPNTDSSVSMMSSDTVKTMEPMEEAGVMVGGAKMLPTKNIVENAAESSDHTTLVAAVKAADLAGTLSGTGPFTVFAPTNEAFNKLPAGTVDNLLKPDMKKDLTKILTYHVVSGKLMASDLTDGQKLKTVEGEELMVTVKDGKVMINGANVTIADVVSSNGVTHVIDAILMPKK